MAALLFALSGCGGSGTTVVTPTFDDTVVQLDQTTYTLQHPYLNVTFSTDQTRSNASVISRIYRSQLQLSPIQINSGKSFAILFDPATSGSADWIVEVKDSAQSSGEWLLGLGKDDLKRVLLSADVSRRQFVITRLLRTKFAEDVTVEGRALKQLTLSPAERRYSADVTRGESHGVLKRWVGNSPQTATEEEIVDVRPEDSLENKKVAVIVHGLHNQAINSLDTFKNIASGVFVNTNNSNLQYDEYWFYEYRSVRDGVKDNGFRLSELLRQHGASLAKSIDFHAHSMGGLVSRVAIEKANAGEFTQRLFTYGTPHKGVPEEVLGRAGWSMNLNDGYRDLERDGSFLAYLNNQDSPYKGLVAYFALAGSRYHDYLPKAYIGDQSFGDRTHDGYVELGQTEHGNPEYYLPVDGIVSKWSAIPSDLHRFGKVGSSSTKILPLHHSDIGRSGSVLEHVREMLRANGSGVIR